jgi:hypothetical protein
MADDNALLTAIPRPQDSGYGEATGYLVYWFENAAYMWFVVDNVWRILQNAPPEMQTGVQAAFANRDVFQVMVSYSASSPSTVNQVQVFTRELV